MAIAKLMNLRYAGKKLNTGFGTIEFNEAGVAEVEDVVANALAELRGFSVQEDNSEEQAEEIPTEEGSQESEQENAGEETEDEEPSEDGDEEESEDEDSEDEDSEDEDSEETYSEEELDKLTVPQLKKIAAEKGINTKDLTKKGQLISAILAQIGEV